MKGIIIYIGFLLTLNLSTPVELVRNQFPNINNLEQADSYLSQLENENSPEAKAYKAILNFMKSRYVTFPFTKLKYFKVGKTELDNVINKNPNNVEIRYLRFLMQKEIPSFLGYNEHINEDLNVIISNFKSCNLNYQQKNKMVQNMLNTKDLTSTEKDQLNKLLKTI